MLADYDVALVRGAAAARRPGRLRRSCAAHSPVPIAGGEVLTRRQSFMPWLEAGAFDIVQPDVTRCGGISEERRIAWMAHDHGVRSFRTAGTPPSALRPTCNWRPRFPTLIWSNT